MVAKCVLYDLVTGKVTFFAIKKEKLKQKANSFEYERFPASTLAKI